MIKVLASFFCFLPHLRSLHTSLLLCALRPLPNHVVSDQPLGYKERQSLSWLSLGARTQIYTATNNYQHLMIFTRPLMLINILEQLPSTSSPSYHASPLSQDFGLSTSCHNVQRRKDKLSHVYTRLFFCLLFIVTLTAPCTEYVQTLPVFLRTKNYTREIH